MVLGRVRCAHDRAPTCALLRGSVGYPCEAADTTRGALRVFPRRLPPNEPYRVESFDAGESALYFGRSKWSPLALRKGLTRDSGSNGSSGVCPGSQFIATMSCPDNTCIPEELSFPIPVKYIDVMRQTGPTVGTPKSTARMLPKKARNGCVIARHGRGAFSFSRSGQQ